MTQEKINQLRQAAYCYFAQANAQLNQNEWRGIDCGCKWKALYFLMLRLQALDRSPLSGEELYSEYVTVVTYDLPALANNTTASATLTDSCIDTTTGKSQLLSTVLVDTRTAYDGVMQILEFQVGSDQYYITGGVPDIATVQANLDILMLARGLDLDMSGFNIVEKIDSGQFRSATNNTGSSKNATSLRTILTSNYNYNQADFTADTTIPLAGANVISILSFTVDGGSLGTITTTFTPALDPTDTNAVIDAFIDLFGVNKVEYTQNGDLANFIATFRFKMTELTKGGPTSYMTFDTDLGNINVPITVDPATIGNGVSQLQHVINTNSQMSGGSINTINDTMFAQWTCTITQCDALDELVSINIDGTDVPFTTPFTMSSGATIGAWLTANAGAGVFTSAWDGTVLTISRTSYSAATHPRYVSWRRVVPFDLSDPVFLQVIDNVEALPAGYTFFNNGNNVNGITVSYPGSFYGKEFRLCYGNGGVPGQGNIYLAEYLNGALQATPTLLYTSPENPWVPFSYEEFGLFHHPSADRLIFVVNWSNYTAPPTYGLAFYSIDSTMVVANIPYTPSGVIPVAAIGSIPSTASTQNWNQATGELLFSVRDYDVVGVGATTVYLDVVAVDPTAASTYNVISVTEPASFSGNTAWLNPLYDPLNNRVWVGLLPPSSYGMSAASYDASTYTPQASYVIPYAITPTATLNKLLFFYTATDYYLIAEPNSQNGFAVFDLTSLSGGTDNFGLSDVIFSYSPITIDGPTANGYLIVQNPFPGRTILIGPDVSVDFYMTAHVPGWAYNPYIGLFTGGNGYYYINSVAFAGTAESDQDSPFNIGQAAIFTQTEEPVIATEDNKCLSDDDVNSVAYQVNLDVDTCCGGSVSTTTTIVTPSVPSYTIYYGSSNNAALDNTGVSALTSLIAPTYAATYSFSATAPDPQYKYVSFPASLGVPSSIIDTSTGYPVTMDTTYLVVISGVSYAVYRTFNELGGAINIQFNP